MTMDMGPTDEEHDDLRMSIPSLLSGSLAAGDRQQVHSHLLTCDECRMELAEICVLPGLIGLLRPPVGEAVRPVEPPDSRLRARLLDEVARRRQRSTLRSRSLALVASIAVLAAGLTIGLTATRPDAGPGGPALVAMAASSPASHVTGAVAAVDKSWGSAVTVQVSGAPQGTRLKLVAVGDDGRTESIAWWSAGEAGDVRCEGSTSMHRDALRELLVKNADDTTLLTYSV